MPRLSEDQRNSAIGMFMAGVAVNAVSRMFGCTKQTIHHLLTRYVHTGTVRDRQRPYDFSSLITEKDHLNS